MKITNPSFITRGASWCTGHYENDSTYEFSPTRRSHFDYFGILLSDKEDTTHRHRGDNTIGLRIIIKRRSDVSFS